MVQIGSRLEVCAWCEQRRMCGEFWKVLPRLRQFICAACLRKAADGIDLAESRLAVDLAKVT